MAIELNGLWTIQDFWIGHHNLLLRQVDRAYNEGNVDFRFEGACCYFGVTAIHDPDLGVANIEHLPFGLTDQFRERLRGRTIYQLNSRTNSDTIHIAAMVLWRQCNTLPRTSSSLIGKYQAPLTVADIGALTRGEWKPTGIGTRWERVAL